MEIDYYDYEQVIQFFWTCSLKKDFTKFNFSEVFENIKQELHNKLSEHAFLSYEDFVETQDEIYDYSKLKELEQATDYIQITQEDLKEAILKYKYKRNKETFEDFEAFKPLKKLYDKLESADNLELKEKIFLFDECIHAEHETGQLLDIKSISDLREEFEKDLKKVEV